MKRAFALIFIALLLCPAALANTEMPIVPEPIVMDMMLRYDTARGVQPTDNAIFQYLAELTNVHWDFEIVDTTAWSEKLNLTWASGDLPDMIYLGVGSDAIMNYTGKLILDLAPYLPEYAPNFWALYEKSDSVKLATTLPNGMIGSFVWTNMDVEIGSGQCPPEILYINQEWLTALDLPMPQSVDEWLDTLRAFRDGDPNGNGAADEIALALRNGSGDLNKLQPLTGFMSGSNSMFLDGDTVRYTPFMDEYKEWLKLCRLLYEEGLIDGELFTISNAQIIAKGSTDVQMYGGIIASAAFTVVGEANANSFVTTPVYTAANGEQMWFTRVFANPGVGIITKDCAYPEEAVRWCDLFYAPEYEKLVWMGIEGLSYEVNEDGTWNWLYSDEYPTATDVRASLTIQAGGQGPSLCPVEWFQLNDKAEAPVNAQRVQIATDYFGKLRVAMPALYYESAVSREMAALGTDLNSYVQQQVALFVTGEADIDGTWDEFTAALKGMGAEQMLAMVQTAYDAVKDKL